MNDEEIEFPPAWAEAVERYRVAYGYFDPREPNDWLGVTPFLERVIYDQMISGIVASFRSATARINEQTRKALDDRELTPEEAQEILDRQFDRMYGPEGAE